MTQSRRMYTMIVCVSVVAANSIHWTIAQLLTHGYMDTNALHNQSGWLVGEGYIEAILYGIIAVFGYTELFKMKHENY